MTNKHDGRQLPALPDPHAVAVAQIPHIVEQAIALREDCTARRDLDGALELRRRLDAFYAYLGDREARAALAREQRLTEVLIGELLGPADGPGHRTDLSGPERLSGVSPQRRHDFRRLAANGDRVRELVDEGVVDRAPILRELDREDVEQSSARARPASLTTQRLRDVLWPLRKYLKVGTDLYGVTPAEARRLLKQVQEVNVGLSELERALEARGIRSRALR